jgi:hypothetical protein
MPHVQVVLKAAHRERPEQLLGDGEAREEALEEAGTAADSGEPPPRDLHWSLFSSQPHT